MSEPAIHRRGEIGYETALADAVWNARKPDRFPDVIVRARTEDDVVAAVRAAREQDLTVGVRAGGHSWSASAVRDGGMLLDVSRLKTVTYDPATERATAQPGVYGSELLAALEPHGRYFPVGHCPTVGLGGYLLQGGIGWQHPLLGPACASVTAVDVVTADGELVRADPHQNSDLYWAARGAGPGFFGAVTRFHLQTHPQPAAMVVGIAVYPLDVLDDVLGWALDIAPGLDPHLEVLLLGTNPRGPEGQPVPGPTAIQIIAVATADSVDQAHTLLGVLDTCPVRDAALHTVTFPAGMDQLFAAGDALEPAGRRWIADNMWTDTDAEVLVPQVRELFTSVPNALSHVLWFPWRDHPLDAAFSNTGRSYLAAYAAWDDPADDTRYTAWVTEQMRRLQPWSKGTHLGDENLVNRPFRYLSRQNRQRIEDLRAKYDPDRRFHSFPGA